MDETTPADAPETNAAELLAGLPDLGFLKTFVQDGVVEVKYLLGGEDQTYTYRPHLPLKRLAQAVIAAKALYADVRGDNGTAPLSEVFTQILETVAAADAKSPLIGQLDTFMAILHPALMVKVGAGGNSFVDVFDLEEATRLLYPFFAKYQELVG